MHTSCMMVEILSKPGGNLVFQDVATQLVVLSSMSHGLTSVCDNHANAIIKNQWKSERCGENELLDSIYLLWCTDWLQPDDVKKMFTHNFFLDVKDLKVSDVEA